MSDHAGYRENCKPVVTLKTILVVRRESALTIKGETRYTVVNGFKAPNPKIVAEKWLKEFLSQHPPNPPAYFLWTPEEFENNTGRKWVMLGY